jgi:hypothetical protein
MCVFIDLPLVPSLYVLLKKIQRNTQKKRWKITHRNVSFIFPLLVKTSPIIPHNHQ